MTGGNASSRPDVNSVSCLQCRSPVARMIQSSSTHVYLTTYRSPSIRTRSRRLPDSESLFFHASRCVAPASISSTEGAARTCSTLGSCSADECGIRHLRQQRRTPPAAAEGDVTCDQPVAEREHVRL